MWLDERPFEWIVLCTTMRDTDSERKREREEERERERWDRKAIDGVPYVTYFEVEEHSVEYS